MLAAATSSPAAMVAFRQQAALGGRGLAALTQGQGIINTRNWIFSSPDLDPDRSILLLKENIQHAKIGQYARNVYLTCTSYRILAAW